MLLVMGFTGEKALEAKISFIDAFNYLESELQKRLSGGTHFMRRVNMNQNAVPEGYFSIINETYIRLHGRAELGHGVLIPDFGVDGRLVAPDISVGKMFASYLKEEHPAIYESRVKYPHVYPDGRHVRAWAYPDEALGVFVVFFKKVWAPKQSKVYFEKKVSEEVSKRLEKIFNNAQIEYK